MIEIFKDIEGYEGLYQISNFGNVYSYNKRGLLTPQKENNGYLRVNLYKNGKSKHYLVHRLVAQAFITNSNNLGFVNHIDENKTNNSVDNLEWTTHKDNVNYGTRNEREGKKISKSLSVPIIGINKTNGLIVEFSSSHEASRVLNINQGNIIQCCKGNRYKSVGGYYWYYK